MTGLLSLLEPEEFVGRHWHRWAGASASWPRFPDAAVALEDVRGSLAVLFRGLGGASGIKLGAIGAEASAHRLSLRLRLGHGQEALPQPRLDGITLLLPAVIDALPDKAQNRALYVWLAAYFAHRRPAATDPDPLRNDLHRLRAARDATQAALRSAAGLHATHAELCATLRGQRPARRLPPAEANIEHAVLALLGSDDHPGGFWQFVTGTPVPAGLTAPKGYRPFLPVPLWGDALQPVTATPAPAEDGEPGKAGESTDSRTRKAQRRPGDQIERSDSLILNRFEKILSLIESLNINRKVDDDDEEGARKALEDADEIGLTSISRKASTRLKVELDLPPPGTDAQPLTAVLTYPEWDYRRRAYHKDHCRVLAGPAAEQGESWQPDALTWRRIRHVRRQFEAFRPGHVVQRAQPDGADYDLDALVRARADLLASGTGSDNVHLLVRRQARDLAALLLVDTSLSTDSWAADRRVLDVAKEAVLVFAHALSACGDDHAILTFTSQCRQNVRVGSVKTFDEPFGPRIARRIGALTPGHYTRMGAAVRHATAQLTTRPHRHRLLLVLTDGKPNDADHYEGRYGIEDTRRAVQEARRDGTTVFGITIDAKAQSYFPTLFGRGGYAIVSNPSRLPAVLPALYRQLSAC
ncbi:MAG: VWA domain-containing protein [Proteobacteria bacterium]|nr:VWA domain-containing protein [Pseudomonadota bacterium]